MSRVDPADVSLDDRRRVSTALPAYSVGDVVGRGAHGVVLEGLHNRLGRRVAIKQLASEFAVDHSVASRFLTEARLLATLDHPHVVRVYDFVEQDGLCLLVMEFLSGGSVADLSRSGRVAPDVACALMLAVCAGLQHAHDRDVLHRDVKPDNLLFSDSSVLKITDFGIAKMIGTAGSSLTMDGSVIGTPAYIAPEQALGLPLGPSADVYGAGTVFYELLSGRLPFPEEMNPATAIYRRVHERALPLSVALPGLPVVLAQVTDRALSPSPGDRYQSAEEFRRAVIAAAIQLWGADWLRRAGMPPIADGDVSDTRGVDGGASVSASSRATKVSDVVTAVVGDDEHCRQVLQPNWPVTDVAGQPTQASTPRLRLAEAIQRTEAVRDDLRLVREELSLSLRQIDQMRFDEASDSDATVEPDGTPPAFVPCPYQGLTPFQAEDSKWFFGREPLIASIVARLTSSSFVGVIGASGSGKSSLVRAGLLPALANGALPTSADWLTVPISPGRDPMTALANGLCRIAPGVPERDMAARLRLQGLASTADELVTAEPATTRVLLVIDQFEEIFTRAPVDEADTFMDALVAAAASPKVLVVIAIRADFYGHCAANSGLATLLQDSQILVGPMSRAELHRAITGPARAVGLVIEPGLADSVVQDAGDEPGLLPLVSTALLETWERRRGRSLTLAGYYEAGGVRGAIGRLADDMYESLDESGRLEVRRILLRLASPGTGGDDFRRRVPLTEIADSEIAHATIATLADRRLITVDDQSVEVAHEALFREWPQLRSWLAEHREGRRLRQQIAAAAAEWQSGGREQALLLRGSRMAAALDYAANVQADLNMNEVQFLDASRRTADAELISARRATRVLRSLLAGVVVILVLAAVAGILAKAQAVRADAAARRATAGRLASDSTLASVDSPDVAALLAVEAFQHGDSLQTRGAMLGAVTKWPRLARRFNPSADRRFGGGLAVFGGGLAVTDQLIATVAPAGILLITRATGDVRTIELKDPFTLDVSFADGGQTVVAVASPYPSADNPNPAGQGLVIQRFSTSTAATVGDPVELASGSGATLSEDGSLAVVGAYGEPRPDGSEVVSKVRFVRTTDGTDVAVFPAADPSGRGVLASAISSDDRLVALATSAEVSIWQAADSTRIATIPLDTPTVFYGGGLAFTPDGSALAVAGRATPNIEIWNVANQQRFAVIPLPTDSFAISIAFDRSGTHMAASLTRGFSSDESQIELADLSSIQQRDPPLTPPTETLSPHHGGYSALAFVPANGTLVEAGSDGVWQWDTSAAMSSGAAPFAAEQSAEPFDSDGPLYWSETGAIAMYGYVLADFGTAKLLRAIDARSGQIIGDVDPHAITEPYGLDGSKVASINSAGELRMIDIASGSVSTKGPFEWAGGGVDQLVLSGDGKRLAAHTTQGFIVVVDVDTGEVFYQRQQASGAIQIVLDRLGSRVAVSDPTGDSTGPPLSVIAVASGVKTSLETVVTFNPRFSPDGSLLMFTSEQSPGELSIVDASSGALISQIPIPVQSPGSGEISQDNRLVVLYSPAGIELFDLTSGQRVGAAITGRVAAFSPDGHTVAVGWSGGPESNAFVIRTFPVDPTDQIAWLCSRAGRNLTAAEWKQYLPDDSYRATCTGWPLAS